MNLTTQVYLTLRLKMPRSVPLSLYALGKRHIVFRRRVFCNIYMDVSEEPLCIVFALIMEPQISLKHRYI